MNKEKFAKFILSDGTPIIQTYPLKANRATIHRLKKVIEQETGQKVVQVETDYHFKETQ